MFATWPMVFGALTAGVIAGFLIPENGPGSPSGSVAAVSDKSTAKTKPEAATPVSVKASEREVPAKNSEREAAVKNSARDEACENQTWPYLTPSCLDRSARNEPPAVVVKTRISEPPTEDSSRAKQAKEAKSAKSPPVAVASTPAEDAGQTQKAPAAAPEKTVQPAKQQAARGAEEPERPGAKSQAPRRADRNRAERRYAGRDDFYDEPRIYIQRGGRLYLAPEYHQRLYPQDGYGREW